jgi:hypothetical protein
LLARTWLHINNKSLKPNAYRRDFQPHIASKGFGKCVTLCWPGIGLAQALGGDTSQSLYVPIRLTMAKKNDSKQAALSHILKVVAAKSGKGVLYTSAIMGIATLVPGLELPGILAGIAGGIGVEALGSILERVANGEKISDDEIINRVEDAVAQSGINNLLTKDEFWHAFAHLRKSIINPKN